MLSAARNIRDQAPHASQCHTEFSSWRQSLMRRHQNNSPLSDVSTVSGVAPCGSSWDSSGLSGSRPTRPAISSADHAQWHGRPTPELHSSQPLVTHSSRIAEVEAKWWQIPHSPPTPCESSHSEHVGGRRDGATHDIQRLWVTDLECWIATINYRRGNFHLSR